MLRIMFLLLPKIEPYHVDLLSKFPPLRNSAFEVVLPSWICYHYSCWLLRYLIRNVVLFFPKASSNLSRGFWGLWCRSLRPPLPLLLATHTKDGCSSGRITSRVISGGGLSWAMGCCHTTGISENRSNWEQINLLPLYWGNSSAPIFCRYILTTSIRI